MLTKTVTMLADVISQISINSNSAHKVFFYTFSSPVGKTTAIADDDYLYIVAFENTSHVEKKIKRLSMELKCIFIANKNSILEKFQEQLFEYFEGNLKKFTVPVKTFGTEFQKAVWEKIKEVPFGSTNTYSDIALSLGRNTSHSRAVGSACGANPLLLVVPCHRLVASGSRGGYNSGIECKDKLLLHEEKFSS